MRSHFLSGSVLSAQTGSGLVTAPTLPLGLHLCPGDYSGMADIPAGRDVFRPIGSQLCGGHHSLHITAACFLFSTPPPPHRACVRNYTYINMNFLDLFVAGGSTVDQFSH